MKMSSSPANFIVLLGLGLAGVFLALRRRRKEIKEDFGAFTKRIQLLPPPQPAPPEAPHPLTGLTFAIKELFDVEGYVTGFGNPDWQRTHEPAVETAPAVSLLVQGGATCVGLTVMDEMAYCMNGVNKHYGTPTNPAAPSRIPGGSSSGSAVAVAAELVDFALGTDTGASVRVPAAFCGILGFRPSHGSVSTVGVVPMAQSLDTVGWFARDPEILHRVGHILLQLPFMEFRPPRRILIADDCFQLTKIPRDQTVSVVIRSTEKLIGGQVLNNISIGKYIASTVPSLKYFQNEEESTNGEGLIASLKALCDARSLLLRYEFKKNHEDWVNQVKPNLGPDISARVRLALETNTDDENIGHSMRVRDEAREALNALLEDDGILVIPTTPGPPPKLNMKEDALEDFRFRTFTLLSIAGMSGCCQATLPVGQHDKSPLGVSFIARHGGDGFLLDTVRAICPTLQEQSNILSQYQKNFGKTCKGNQV
uniref:TSA: Wollemia nobilis Ref_Wollemi_Transcript_14877_1955 transcribed RNA sequence n=1 Tax=Wollemia nobilis TaxID=56998 RepID=A0A0C9RSN2_9CONI